MKTFLADSGLFGLDLSADASAAKDKTLLMLYQPVTMLNKKQYTSDEEQDKMMRTLYKKFLLLVSMISLKNIIYRENRFPFSYLSLTLTISNIDSKRNKRFSSEIR